MACGAVAYCKNPYRVFFNKALYYFLCLFCFVFGRNGVYNACIKHLARAVYHGDLAAGAVAGVKTYCNLILNGRLHKQLMQVC